MSSINQLSEASSISSSMQLPVYDTSNGQPRKISVQQLQEYLAANPVDPTVPTLFAAYSVAELPSAIGNDYSVVYCTNGDAGNPCLAVSNGSTWKRIALGATVSAS